VWALDWSIDAEDVPEDKLKIVVNTVSMLSGKHTEFGIAEFSVTDIVRTAEGSVSKVL